MTDVVGRDAADPFREKRSFKISSIKFDQESFSFLPLDANDRIVFDGVADTAYDVSFRLYTVHGVPTKRFLLELGSQSLFKTVWSAAQGIVAATTDYLGKEVVDWFKGKTEEPLFWEQLLLKASAELEFKGSFRLAPSKGIPAGRTLYALYDVLKSEVDVDYDQNVDDGRERVFRGSELRLPRDKLEYLEAYARVHRSLQSVILPDALPWQDTDQWKREATKAYIRFYVSSGGPCP